MIDAWDLPASELSALERFEGILKRIEVRRFPMEIALACDHSPIVGHVRVRCSYPWLDSYGSGKEVTVTMIHDLPMGLSEPGVVRACRDLMVGACLHELDEALHFDGQRVHDPHEPWRALGEAARGTSGVGTGQ